MHGLSIYLLGAPRIECDGQPVEFDTRKATALLAYLAVTGESHPRDQLAALLWPDYDQTSARAALRRTLSTLNHALSQNGQSWLEIDREAISLRPQAGYWFDVEEFRRQLAGRKTHGHSEGEVCPDCLPLLKRAAELYRDDFLSGFSLRDSSNFDDWQFFQGEGLKSDLANALEKLAAGYSAAGQFEAAIPYARRWLSLDPLREEAHRELMLLYAWSGQRNAALRQYRECVRILEQELGVSPLEETSDLHQSILEGQTPPPPSWPKGKTSPAASVAPSQAAEAPSKGVTIPLIGRRKEWSSLEKAYQEQGENGFFFVLEGEPGIGKTRLAEDFIGEKRLEGATAVATHCYPSEAALAYGPFTDGLRLALTAPGRLEKIRDLPKRWLSEIARLLPELETQFPGLPPAASLDAPGAQASFFEGIRQALSRLCAGKLPGIIFIDDLHWADPATLDLLTYLLRRLRGQSLFLLGAWRDEPTPAVHRLQALAAEARRAGSGGQIILPRFQISDIRDLVHSMEHNGVPLPENLEERLYLESEGLPFFTVEYLATLREGVKTISAGELPMPHSVRELLASRLAQVSETGRQLLSTAAVVGRSFDFEILRLTSGRSETETISGIEELVAQGLIQEKEALEAGLQGEPVKLDQSGATVLSMVPVLQYDFSHEKLRAFVYEEIGLARRRLLHRRAAEALAGQSRSRVEMAGLERQIAYHFQMAGQETQAAEYFRQAGEHARALFANAEALEDFRAAIALGDPDPAGLYEAIGDLQTLQGEYSAALASYEAAASLCRPACAAAIEHKLGIVHHRRGQWELAESRFQTSLELLGSEGDPGQKALLYADWSRTAHHRENDEQAQSLAEQARLLAEEGGHLRALSEAHNMLGMIARKKGQFELASQHLEQSLALAEKMGAPADRVAALNNLALVYGDSGDVPKAIRLAEKALQQVTQQGDRHREAALNNNLADLYHAAGDAEKALAHLKKAVVIFAEIGDDTGSAQPETWMLTEW